MLSFSLGIKVKKLLKRKSFAATQDILHQQKIDLFIPTYYDPYFLTEIGSKPFVLTVYDMINELFPQCFPEDLTTIPNKKLLMEKATKIIAISESTKRDILSLYPHIEESKIEIVYLGFTIIVDSELDLKLPENYILFIGNRGLYKNFDFFLHSIAPLLKKNKNLFLVCAGGNSFTSKELEMINELKVADQIIQRNFKDNELGTYYKNAKCFVFPSEYEGFGIPVLESMACGCPVVLANHSSFPEVAGEAGIYFELNKEVDLRNKIENLLNDNNLRTQFKIKGLKQVKKFSWEICAERVFKIYQSLIN